jgi:hypothetical protein
MSRHHNTKHPLRGLSHYHERLIARGLGKAPLMPPLSWLRTHQERRVHETCTLGPQHECHECNGVPWKVRDANEELTLAA